jgi:hypothetical protein
MPSMAAGSASTSASASTSMSSVRSHLAQIGVAGEFVDESLVAEAEVMGFSRAQILNCIHALVSAGHEVKDANLLLDYLMMYHSNRGTVASGATGHAHMSTSGLGSASAEVPRGAPLAPLATPIVVPPSHDDWGEDPVAVDDPAAVTPHVGALRSRVAQLEVTRSLTCRLHALRTVF